MYEVVIDELGQLREKLANIGRVSLTPLDYPRNWQNLRPKWKTLQYGAILSGPRLLADA